MGQAVRKFSVRNLSIAIKIAIPLVVFGCFFLLLAITTVFSLSQINRQFDILERDAYQLLNRSASGIRILQSFHVELYHLVLVAATESDLAKLGRLTAAIENERAKVDDELVSVARTVRAVEGATILAEAIDDSFRNYSNVPVHPPSVDGVARGIGLAI